MIDHTRQSRESSVVIKPAFQMCKQLAYRGRPIAMIRCAVSLKAVDADFCWPVQVPSRIGPEWFDVAAIALSLAAEKLVTTLGSGLVETAGRRLFGRNRELVELKSLKL